jgi:hypothetical protein
LAALVAICGVAVAVGGVAAVMHGAKRLRDWDRLPGPLLPWWQALPLAYARPRLEPFDKDTQDEQLGTMGEILAGLAAILLGVVVAWAVVSGSVNVR